jgi:hypothetical protein
LENVCTRAATDGAEEEEDRDWACAACSADDIAHCSALARSAATCTARLACLLPREADASFSASAMSASRPEEEEERGEERERGERGVTQARSRASRSARDLRSLNAAAPAPTEAGVEGE